jgi:Na+-transporting methylmalonyl-CoA/oxaloacetate decarboxylase gamma subunit
MVLLNVDSQTVIITVVGWMIVFLALVLLIFVFTWSPKLINFKLRKKMQEITPDHKTNTGSEKYISGDETAAIAMALYLYFEEQHDEESNVLTIKQIRRRYSPWSSKIYGVRNFPNIQ